MKFQELNLCPPILRSLDEEGYTEPTPIQKKAIPIILKGNDVLGSAQTGTGKTAAFAIPILELMQARDPAHASGRRKIRTLVVTPTRELAIQIGDSFTTYGRYTKINNTVVFGGVSQNNQINRLNKGVDILIATPGRLLDLINQGFITLKDISFFVLDEADRMLDMGFINDIKKIIAQLPKRRQSLFFSATLPRNIIKLSNQILTNPKRVEVSPVSSTADTIQQFLYLTNKKSKFDLLLHVLENPRYDQVLLFSRTKHGSDKIVRRLKKANISSAAIHGDKSQNQRQRALGAFKDGKIRVLVATDIAARGIDIDKLNYVINFDIPNESETYVHRIGRCGRAGEDGVSLSICEPEELEYVKDIERLINKRIKRIDDHPYPQTDKPMTESEKKIAEKEKQRRKQEFFANRKKKQRPAKNQFRRRGGR